MTWIPAEEFDTIGGIGQVKKIVDGTERTFNSAFETTGEVQTISGLPDGTYRLYEVFVPGGYFRSFEYIQFTIENRAVKEVRTDAEDTSVVKFTAAGDNALALLEITNKRSYNLPSTGGPGTMLFTFFGGMMLAFAGIGFMILMNRRRQYC